LLLRAPGQLKRGVKVFIPALRFHPKSENHKCIYEINKFAIPQKRCSNDYNEPELL
jgi:hypothetical protein